MRIRSLSSLLCLWLCASATAANSAVLAEAAPEPSRPVILFFGDSITAGYRLEPAQAFPNLIQRKLDTLGWRHLAVNAGQSGETSAGGVRRIDWLLRHAVDILVLELGANDALRGLPLEATEKNLQRIIDKVRDRYPEVRLVIAGMRVPPNLGPEYTQRFEALFAELAERNDAILIPFLLEGVAGVRSLNLADGIHPTPEGHKILAETVWRVLEPLLRPAAK